jgi:formylglycine-generating enzyme required for sulfatase activity
MFRQVLIGLALLAGALLPASAPGRAQDDEAKRILGLFAGEFIPVTPGEGKFPATFVMGSDKGGKDDERPAHKVTLARPFAMAKYEVTQELYHLVMGGNPSKWKGLRNSVEKITWDEAVTFCRKATEALRERGLLKKDEEIRLPSEAEWEYVCRAGTTTAYSFGDDEKDLGAYAWFTGNAAGNDPPVGKKKANPWGFYDLHGYVWEWCADAWHPSYEGAQADGAARGGDNVKDRVIRGGSWRDVAERCRSAARGRAPTETRGDHIGLRCVRAPN